MFYADTMLFYKMLFSTFYKQQHRYLSNLKSNKYIQVLKNTSDVYYLIDS